MDSLTLIHTKLCKPRVASDLVERPRLMEKLNRNLDRTLTLVAAPAGYGKSTLVARWLEGCTRPNAWLSLDKGDSDLDVFLRYFIAAVQTIFPDVGKGTLTLLQAPEHPPLRVIAATLINALDRIEEPFLLALDDYHLIHDLAVHDLMNELLRYAPRSLHLVMISRLNPPFDLYQLRAHGQMVEIRVEDLRFTPEETRAFARKAWQVPLDEADAVRLQEKTEGWATGLRLCFLSMNGPDDFDALAKRLPGRGLVTEYLFHEVFTRQPEAVQEYMLKTSILDRFSAPLCEHLLDASGRAKSMSGETFIRWLQQADIFIIALDDEQKWFRYHHLFQALLERQLAQTYGDEGIAHLHRRASEWFARRGLAEEAIQHALAAGDAVMAGEIIARHRVEMLNADQREALERWLSYLPSEVISQSPELLLAQLGVLEFRYDFEAFPPLLQQLDALLQTEVVDPMIEGQAAFFQGVPLLWQGQNERAAAYFQHALALLPPEHEQARGETTLYLATAKQMSGQGEELLRTFQAQLRKECKDGAFKGRLLGALIFIHFLSGQLKSTFHYAGQLLEMVQRVEDAYLQGWAHFVLGQIHFDWQMLDAAISHFSQAVEYRYFLDHDPRVESFVGLAFSYQASGKEEEADAVMKQLTTFLQEYPNPRSTLIARSAGVRLAILRGDIDRARYLQRLIDFSSDQGTMLFWLELPRITQCRLLIAAGTPADLKEAERLLTEHLRFARQTHNAYQEVGILALLALAYQRQRQLNKALSLLSEAVSLAESGEMVRPFVEGGEEMARMLRALLKQPENTPRNFIRRLLNAFPQPRLELSRSKPVIHPLVEPLTNRELEILTLLARRYTNKEIATELVISVATVKRHASNIYGKLQVNGRRAAVEKALSLGLIRIGDGSHYSPMSKKD